jgi:tripeptidyl-peptidase-1
MKFSALAAALAVSMSCSFAAMDRVFPARSVPKSWSHLAHSVVEPTRTFSLRIALFPKDGKKLESVLRDVSTPGSKNFRKYLKGEEITAIVGRDNRELDELKQFFYSNGFKVSSVHPNKDWIFVEGTASAIENVFKCKLENFEHKIERVQRVGKK